MKQRKIYVAGHRGMVGSAIVRALNQQGQKSVIGRTRQDMELTDQAEVNRFLAEEKPEEIYLAAAKVGGIFANTTYPADFLYDNLMVQANIISAAFEHGVKKLLFLGSSCIYPKLAVQPMREEALLSGVLEPTNEPYAIAKIAGIKLCESYNRQYGQSHGVDYRSVMPTNLYGVGDNYHPDHSHVIPGLLRRFHHAKLDGDSEVVVWGTGNPRREFLFVDDLARACIQVMDLPLEDYRRHAPERVSHINVGYGEDVSIAELAHLIGDTVGYRGKIVFDTSKPDGTPRKLLDSSRINAIGWRPRMGLADGLKLAYADFLAQHTARPQQ